MQLNKARVKELINGRDLSQNQLAAQIGVSRGSLSNALSGRRGVGRKLLAGLLRILPGETLASLIVSERQDEN
ncbi:MAG: helix-turn-helix transcriptional regulator [Negativicutes bacterium]|nr:helix-turn-helix transcriptional regulator [Negativicutes bacterium]